MKYARIISILAFVVGSAALGRADTVDCPVLSAGGSIGPGLMATVGEFAPGASGAGATLLDAGAVGCWTAGFGIPGDINGDGLVNASDRDLFVRVLLGLDTDSGHLSASDLNGDGIADGRDIQPFVSLLIP